MKLITEYSWPLRDKVANTFRSYPMVSEQKIVELTNEFLAEATKYVTIPGFHMAVRVEGS